MNPRAMNGMNPPSHLVDVFACPGIDAGKGLGQVPAAEGPDLPGGMRSRWIRRASMMKPVTMIPSRRQQHDGVIRRCCPAFPGSRGGRAAGYSAGRPPGDADQDGDAEQIHQEGEDEVDGPAQKGPAERLRDMEFRGIEGRPEDEDQKTEDVSPCMTPG